MRHIRRASLPLAAIVLTASACTTPGPVSDHFYIMKPAGEGAGAPNPHATWLVLLPGGSGLDVFGDDQVYFRAGNKLAEAGFAVCLVDYHSAYDAARDAPSGNTGVRIAWAVEQAVQWLQQTGQMNGDGSVMLVSYSLGAEGVWELTEAKPSNLPVPIEAAAVFFPSNLNHRVLSNGQVPLLVQTGAADDLTTVDMVRDTIHDRPNVTLYVYEGAYHGYTASSLPAKKRARIFPIIGPRFWIGYHREAAEASNRRLVEFLRDPGGR